MMCVSFQAQPGVVNKAIMLCDNGHASEHFV